MHQSSEEYQRFIEEYNIFLEHYAYSSRLTTMIKTSKQQNIQVNLLYEKAVQAQIDAKNSYTKALVIYEQLIQKWLLVAKSCYADTI